MGIRRPAFWVVWFRVVWHGMGILKGWEKPQGGKVRKSVGQSHAVGAALGGGWGFSGEGGGKSGGGVGAVGVVLKELGSGWKSWGRGNVGGTLEELGLNRRNGTRVGKMGAVLEKLGPRWRNWGCVGKMRVC